MPSRIPMSPLIFGLLLATLLTIHALPQSASVLLLVFAGIVLAVALDALTSLVQRVLPGGHGLAYAVALLCVILGLAILVLLIGPQLADQVPQLIKRVPKAWATLLSQLKQHSLLAFASNEAG